MTDKSLTVETCVSTILCGINPGFPRLSHCHRQVAHALLTRSPLSLVIFHRGFCLLNPVRLACVKHAASVRPEPGSNSQFNVCLKLAFQLTFAFFIFSPNYCLVCTSLKVFTLFNLLRFFVKLFRCLK